MHVVVFREKKKKGILSQLPAEDNERAGNVCRQHDATTPIPSFKLQDNQDFFSGMNAAKGPRQLGKRVMLVKNGLVFFFVPHALQSVCVMSQSLRAALCQPLTVPMTAAPDSL